LLALLSGFLVVENSDRRMWDVALRNITFFGGLLLRLGVQLVNVFLNICTNDKHIVDELVTVGPGFGCATVVFNQNVFFFESMIEQNFDLFCS